MKKVLAHFYVTDSKDIIPLFENIYHFYYWWPTLLLRASFFAIFRRIEEKLYNNWIFLYQVKAWEIR